MTPQPTPALPPPEGEAQAATELDRLKSTSDAAVGRGSSRVAGITPEQEEGHKRAQRSRARGAIADLKVGSIYVGFGLSVLLATAVTLGAVWAIFLWVGDVVQDQGRLDTLVHNAVWTGLVAVASLYIQRVFGKSDGD